MERKNIPEMIAVLVVIVLIGFAIKVTVFGKQTAGANNNNDNDIFGTRGGSGEIQEVTLSWKASNYDPQIIKVKAGAPVRITADLQKITGCFRSIVITDLGVQKYFKAGDNTLTFTPQKKGTFGFSCAMGMGRGTIIVE